MGAFEYTALDPRGRKRRGVLEGDTARNVRHLLREQGLSPVAVQPVTQRKSRSGFKPRSSIGSTELALFTRQLATLVRSGLPLEEALLAVSQQSEARRVQRVVLGIRARVLEGHNLADALQEMPQIFSRLYIATVAAGEQTGRLDMVLERLAEYVENRQVMRQKIMLATFYPAILTIVAFGVVALLLTYVVPQVVDVFDSIDADLPPLTTGLIAVSEFLQQWGLALLIALIFAVFVFRFMMRRASVKRSIHRQILRIPLVGRLVRGTNTGQFARTFSILVNSGVPVLDAIEICAQVVNNLPMKEAIQNAGKRVREGTAIHKALEQSRLFPPITLHLIANGEQSGQLGPLLERAADNQEREVETLIAALMGVFEPMLILGMGGMVLIIVLAILLPIFDLNQLVQ